MDELPAQDILLPASQGNHPQLWAPEAWVQQFARQEEERRAKPVRIQVHVHSASDEHFFNLTWVCDESRKVFKKAYSTLKFRHRGVNLPWNRVKNTQLREIEEGRKVRIVPGQWYNDYKRDTLEFEIRFIDTLESCDGCVDLTQVQNVAFWLTRALSSVPILQPRPNSTIWLWGFLAGQCTSLKTLTFSLGQIQHRSREGYESTCNLIKIDDQTLHTIVPYLKASVLGSWEGGANDRVEAVMKTPKELAQGARNSFEGGIAANESLKLVKFEVAFVSTYRRRLNEPEKLWVAPSVPSHHGSSFWVKRPAAINYYGGYQIIYALRTQIQCHADGALMEKKSEE